MKILFLQKMNGISGSELYMLQILPELKRRGYDVEMLIVYPTQGDNNGRYIQYLAEHGIKTHEIYGHNAVSPLLYKKIYGVLKRGKYDLVQANLIHADTWMSVMKFFFFRKMKLISVKHGYDSEYQAKYGYDLSHLRKHLFFWIEYLACKVIDFNITISGGLYNAYVKGGIVKAEKIRNIYYGLTLSAPIVQSNDLKIPEGPYAIITGRLFTWKGHEYLINAWKKVVLKHPSFKLYIAGDGPDKERLVAQVASLGLEDSVIFMGHVPNPHPIVANSRFTLVTSRWEGFGLILLESWMHKKAIIAFDAPAMNEVIDDQKNGLLVKTTDIDDLADKIIYLFEHNELAQQFGEDGYHKLKTYFTLKRMTDETEEVYQAVYNNMQVPLKSKEILVNG